MRRMTEPVGTARVWSRSGETGPPVDLYETAEAVVVRMALPGAEGTSLALTVGDESLTVRGESPHPGRAWEERTVVHWQEIPYGRFERTVPLPVAVSGGAARAQFRNGLLEITLPKQRLHDARTIPISVSGS
jgi:HSP20 family protein